MTPYMPQVLFPNRSWIVPHSSSTAKIKYSSPLIWRAASASAGLGFILCSLTHLHTSTREMVILKNIQPVLSLPSLRPTSGFLLSVGRKSNSLRSKWPCSRYCVPLSLHSGRPACFSSLLTTVIYSLLSQALAHGLLSAWNVLFSECHHLFV